MFSRRRSYLKTALLAATAFNTFAAPSFTAGDPYRENVILDVRQTGSDASVNNDFTDSSATGHTITANGDATQGAFSPHQPTGWSIYATTEDWIDLGTTITLDGDFTCEAWFKVDDWSPNGTYEFLFFGESSSTSYLGSKSSQMCSQLSAGGENLKAWSVTPEFGEWHHWCWMRSGTVVYHFIDGLLCASGATETNDMVIDQLNNWSGSAYGNDAAICDLRITNTAEYAITGFAPPTEALTAVTGTQLLLSVNSSRIVDTSGNDNALTMTVTPRVIAGSPYGQTVAYNPATHGGSLYLDGSGDYLTAPDHAEWFIGTGEFSMRGWFYITSRAGAYDALVGQSAPGSSGPIVYLQGDAIGITNNGGTPKQESVTIELFTWHHFECSRDSSDDLRFFFDGVELGSATNTAVSMINSTAVMSVGARGDALASTQFKGYLADIEVIVGSGGNVTAFTPPTSPPTAIANTKFLMLAQDAAIYDASCNSNLELYGTAQLDTANVKYDDGAMVLDASGGFFETNSPSGVFNLGLSNFTWECWVDPANWTGNQGLLWIDGGGSTSDRILVWFQTNSITLTTYAGGTPTTRITGTAIGLQFQHIALTRHDGTFRLFADGAQVGSDYSVSYNVGDVGHFLRCGAQGAGSNALEGSVEGVRITKGVARYLGTFTPNAAEHPEIHGYSVDAEATTDVYFDKVQLLLKTLSSDALDNNAFTDSSASAHTLTAEGDATQGSFTPFQPNGWSTDFDGTGGGILFTDTADWDFGTGDFTVEAWINLRSLKATVSNAHALIGSKGASSSQFNFLIFAGKLNITSYNTIDYTSAATAMEINKWHHVAITRTGTTVAGFFDGNRIDTATNSKSYHFETGLYIGDGLNTDGSREFDGMIHGLRVLKGTALYTDATYTVPTELLTDITNTELLSCQTRSFGDETASPHGISSVASGIKVVAGNPFLSTVSYDPATHGGSVQVNRSTDDSLTITGHADFELDGAFCIETFLYYSGAITTDTQHPAMLQLNHASLNHELFIDAGSDHIGFWDGSAFVVEDSSAFTPDQWSHVVVCRDASNNFALFVNGARVDTATNSNTFGGTSGTVRVGSFAATTGTMNGHLAEFRIVNGSEVYDPTVTTLIVPTAPLTAITNTVLLIPAQGAGIYDAACRGNILLEGNLQTDTAEFKFGPSSLLLDGTGDGLVLSQNDAYEIADQDFCIEGWVYYNTHNDHNHIIDYRTNSGQASVMMYSSADGILHLYVSAADRLSSRVLSTGVWYYIALARRGGVTRLFVNGEIDDEWIDATTYLNPGALNIGINYLLGNPLDGQMEDWRLTIGEARYTADFAIPTTDLPSKGA